MAALLNQSYERLDVMPERRTMTASTGRVGLIAVAQAEPVRQAVNRGRATAGWAIQVGSFSTERAARDAAAAGRRAADGGDTHIESAVVRHRTVWRAIVTGLTAGDAQAACATLARKSAPCSVLRPDSRQVASR
jgi:hypothetical protein